MWSIYLPYDYSYHYFSSTLEKEELIRGLNLFAGSKRAYDESFARAFSQLAPSAPEDRRKAVRESISKEKDYKSSFRNIPAQEEQLTDQLGAELEFAGRLEGLAGQEVPQSAIRGGYGAGVLPIQIQIPTGGQVYRFARTIVRSEDGLTVSVLYSRSWVGRTLTWIIVIAVVLLVYLNRRRLARLRPAWTAIVGICHRHDAGLRKCARSAIVPFVMFGLLVVSLPFSRFLVLLFFLLFWVTTAYQVILYRRKRSRAKAEAQTRNALEDSSHD
jgi:hypothetical protein